MHNDLVKFWDSLKNKKVRDKERKFIVEGDHLIDEARKKFTIIYEEIINLLQNSGKKIILDGTQLRFIDDVKKIRGELIVLRPSIETCVSRSVERKQAEHPELSTEELKNYEQRRRETLYRLNPFLNEMVSKVAEFATFEEFIIEKTNKGIKL